VCNGDCPHCTFYRLVHAPASVNKNTLNEAFYEELSMYCMAYLEQMRVNIAKYFLQFSDYSVSYISEMCGYNDTNYFAKVFKKHTGITASEFQKQVRGMDMSGKIKKLLEPDN
jgi:YesN/AraC family two-component response regulator